MLDAMKILHVIWSKNRNYATEAGIKRCWRKADILPPAWNQDTKNDVGSNSISEKDNRISDNDCELLCNFTKNIQTNTTSADLDTSTTVVCFGDYFTYDTDAIYLEESAWSDMASNCICIGYDIDILE